MKQWLKKQKLKIAIALCSILSVFTLFLGINNTYAYNTNQFTYTIDTTSSDITMSTINNINGYIYTRNTRLYTINNFDQDSVILINFYLLDSSNTIVYSSSQQNISIFSYLTSSGNNIQLYYGYQIRLLNSNDSLYYNIITPINYYGGNFSTNNFWINQGTSYKLFITNIDVVSKNDVGLSQYYDTYYGAIEDNYNALLEDYDTLEGNYNTLQDNYEILESNYNDLQDNYDSLLQQKNDLEEEILSKQNQINTLTNELNRLNSEYNNIINVSAPFNPNNIGVATVSFNNTLLDIPYSSFVIFDYFQIELDLFDFDLIDNYNANSNHLIITLNLLDPKDFGTLKYWCNMRDSVGDYLSIYYYTDSTLIYSLEYMNNEHTDNNGDMAPYYLDSANNINRVVFDFFLNDDYSSNNPYSNNTDYLIQYGTYSQGYNDGLNAANEYNDIIINNYQVEIQGYNDVIDNLHVEVTNLKQQINIKDAQIKTYQQGANDYNLNRMIWTIASTPFESFKQIWNVNFFGVNISTMITGFITGIIVLWIIKKFFL